MRDLALLHFNDVYNIQDGKFARFVKELREEQESMKGTFGQAGSRCDLRFDWG